MAITITNISWTRTYLEVDYEGDPGAELMLYRVAEQRFVPFTCERKQLGETEYVHATLNVVIAYDREPLSAGDWILCTRFPDDLLESEFKLFDTYPYLHDRAMSHVRRHTNKWLRRSERYIEHKTLKERWDVILENPYETHSITYTTEVLENLGNLAQVFRYVRAKYVYTASLIPRSDSTDYPYVVLMMGFYERNDKPRIRKRSMRFKEKRVFAAIATVESALAKRSGRDVLFLKTNGDEPTPNMEAVRERMVERGLDKEYRIRERYRNVYGHKRQNPISWLKDIRLISTSDYIFIDDYCPVFNFVKPKNGTVLTQIWHAGVGFKSVGYARFGIGGSPDPYNSSHRAYTYALVGNEHLRQIYSEVFGIEQEALLATGMPRLDHFLDEDVIEQARADLHERYPWMKDGRVIVFAPTFRGAGQRTAYYPYENFIDMDMLYEMCEKTNSYFVFEMHHFIKRLPEIPEEYQDRIIDLSEEDLTGLYHVSDVLVTDYSSCFYDYLLLKKPVVFYVPDKIMYEVTRGVQRTVDEMAPGVVCETFEDFMHVLETNEYENVEPHPSCLDRRLEGDEYASDRVIDTILLGKDVPGVKMQ